VHTTCRSPQRLRDEDATPNLSQAGSQGLCACSVTWYNIGERSTATLAANGLVPVMGATLPDVMHTHVCWCRVLSKLWKRAALP
jgi:hypothetical protein